MKTLALSVCGILALSVSGIASTIAEYTFDNGANGQAATILADSSGNGLNGTALGGPTYRANTPSTPGNLLSLGLGAQGSGGADALSFNYGFPLDTLTDASLTFWLNPDTLTAGHEQNILWTTTSSGDTNRFNMGIDASGILFIDYRNSSGSLNPGAGTAGLVAGQWNFVSIVKSGTTIALSVNNLAPVYMTTVLSLPTSAGWTFSGRDNEQPIGCCSFSGFVDDITLSDTAAPEPASFALVGLGLAAFGARRLRRS